MRRLPNKKVILLVVTLLFLAVGILWYVGYKNNKDNQKKQLDYYNKLITEQSNLGTITNRALQDENELKTLQAIVVPIYKADLASTSSPEIIKAYGSNLAKITLPLVQKHENENEIMLRALDNNDPNEIKKLVALRVNYEKVVDDLKKAAVPPTAEKVQGDLVFTLSTITEAIRNMEKILQEPVLALQSGKVLNRQKLNLLKNFDSINNYFKQNGISFTSSNQLSI